MTRINVGITPKKLVDKHLLAEHREIKRVCYYFKKAIDSKTQITGHPFSRTKKDGNIAFTTLFFLDKGLYTYNRYVSLYKECISRGFSVQDFTKLWDVYIDHPNYFADWKPDATQVDMLRLRIAYRLSTMSNLKYAKKDISLDSSLKLLHNG